MYPLSMLLLLVTTTEASLSVGANNDNGKKNCVGESYNPTTDNTYCGTVPKTCVDTEYRSIDGSCNNLNYSWWGTPRTPFKRALSCNSYADCVYKMPGGPNPRKFSLSAFVDINTPDMLWTLGFMQYGQIIAHDMSLDANVPQAKRTRVICCYQGKLTVAATLDPKCAPIILPDDDPYNAPEGIECMDFYRTETTKDTKCVNPTKVAEPLNYVTALLDASYIYGSDEKTAKSLREFKGGRLISLYRNGQQVMPQDPNPTVTCDIKSPTEPCYYAGDKRVNQNPQLALLQNIYLAQHNTIANKFAELNPQWDDEKIYQETRKFVIAQHQHVTYYEYLVGLIGYEKAVSNKLIYPEAKTFINDYDPKVNPATSSEFSSAAFRYFHTQIMGYLWSYKQSGNVSNVVILDQWFDKPSVCEYDRNYVGLTTGLSRQPMSTMDRYMPNDILQNMFKYGITGEDLKAVDIQRGRDHGLCSYVQALRLLFSYNPKNFQDLKFISPKNIKILSQNYNSIEEIDLLAGISLETRLPYSLSTPTVEALVIEQMKRTRQGDRCFYENGDSKCAFTIEQLNEIRECSTFAYFLCFVNGFDKVQPQAFKLVSPKNPLKSCSEIRQCNFSLWKDNSGRK